MRPLLGTLVLAFLPGCTTDLELSPRAQVGCSDASPCPPGFVCNQAGRCERTDALDRTPPALLTGPDLTPPRGRTGTTFSLSFEVSEPLSIAPEVTIDLGARQAPWEAAGQEGDGYTFTYEATGGEPEGERDVSIRLLDLAGNELVDASASLSFDFTPPRLLAEPAPSPTQLRDGATARLELLVSEALAEGATPEVRFVEGPAWPPAEAGGDGGWVATYQAHDGEDDEGRRAVVVSLEDGAGNRTEDLPAGTVTFDFTDPVAVAEALTPEAVREGALFRLRVEVDHPLASEPELEVTGPEGQSPPVPGRPERQDLVYVWTHEVVAGDAEGTYGFSVGLTDLAGNTDTAALTSVLRIDKTPPAIEADSWSVSHGGVVGAGDVPEVTLSVDEPLGEPPRLALGQQDLGAPETSVEEPLRYTFRHTVQEVQGGDGAFPLVAELVDEAGNRATDNRTLGRVTLDFTAPSLVPGTAELRYVPAADNVLDTVESAMVGTCVRVFLTLDEPAVLVPGETPALTADKGEDVIPLSVEGDEPCSLLDPGAAPAARAAWRFSHTVAAGDPDDGVYALAAEVRDAVGNGRTLDLPSTLVLDTERPLPPDVLTRDAVVYSRYPWGDAAGDVYYELRGGAGAVAEAGTVLVYSPSPLAEIGRGPSRADGSFAAIRLNPVDLATVLVASSDGAGNRSEHLVAVRDVEWTATLGGKVAGSVVVNPHRLEMLEWLAPWPVRAGADGVEEVGADAGVALDDGAALESAGAGRWIGPLATGAEPAGRRRLSLARDAARGRIVLAGGCELPDGCDGGGARWTWEWGPRGWERVSTIGPPARWGAALVYDAARAETLLFGGQALEVGFEGAFCDLPREEPLWSAWAWNGSTWRVVEAEGPSPRTGVAAAYDGRRQRVVLFGGEREAGCGEDAGAYCGWTWEWDGRAWSVAATEGPHARSHAGMVWDARRGKVVLFGGGTCDGCEEGWAEDCGWTWEWDGEQWTVAAEVGPSARVEPALAWDAGRERVVLFGGAAALAPTGCAQEGGACHWTWVWDGETWDEAATEGPGHRRGAAMEYDAGADAVLLVGGEMASGPDCDREPMTRYCAETWAWDGEGWVRLTSDGPVGRDHPGLAFDAGRGVTVLLGSTTRDNAPCGEGFNEYCFWTWERGPGGWRAANEERPPWRSQIRLAWDGSLGRVVMLGSEGEHGATPCGWEVPGCVFVESWSGEAWERLETPGPRPRTLEALAWDEGRDRLVLFGGDAGADDCGEGAGRLCGWTWEWDGQDWHQPSTEGPAARRGHAMAWDAARGRTVLLGGEALDDCGEGHGATCGRTWEWDGVEWTAAAEGGPAPRLHHALAYDPARERVVLFSGTMGDAGEAGGEPAEAPWTWEWDGQEWHPVATGGPVGREKHALAYDPTRGRVLLFGGHPGGGETWEWDGGGGDRPAHVAGVAYAAARATGYEDVRSVAVEWRAGGVGYPDGVTTAGAELLVWRHDEGRWWDVEVRHDAGPDAPATLRWSGDDAAVLPQLFGGAGRSVYVAVVPRAVSGPGSRDGGARRARVATDWLGVTVRYDLGFPAHDTCAGPAEPQPDGDGVWRLAGHLGRARDTTAGSCSGLGAASDLVFLAELEAGAWVVTRRAGGPLTVYLRRAGCADGEEVACVTLAGDAGPAEAELGELEAGATWVFVESAEPGEFELGLAQVEAPGGGGS